MGSHRCFCAEDIQPPWGAGAGRARAALRDRDRGRGNRNTYSAGLRLSTLRGNDNTYSAAPLYRPNTRITSYYVDIWPTLPRIPSRPSIGFRGVCP